MILDWLKNSVTKITKKDKDKVCDVPFQKYSSLSPVEDSKSDSECIKALSWALKQSDINNIALAGPYGSGKSSIINTFLKNNPEISNNTLCISLANFENGTHSNKLEIEDIQVGILKQLFYKVSHRTIPQSRYRRPHNISYWRVLMGVMIALIFALVTTFVLWPDVIYSLAEKIVKAGSALSVAEWLTWLIASVVGTGMILTVTSMIRFMMSRIKLKEVKISKNVSFKKDEDKESIFDKNIDEIIYFFEATKYRVVVFEDIDRLNNISIFVALRELNNLLNKNDAIKDKVVFLYAVRDDIFSETDRTKFFDFIIPVIPFANPTNAGEVLLRKFKDAKLHGDEYNISQDFILDISPYIKDMRLLQNMYNEFLVYKSTLNEEQKLDLLDERMFALVFFKNLYPDEFAKLQMESGLIKDSFNNKKEFVNNQINNIQEEIIRESDIITTTVQDFVKSRKELKILFLSEMLEWKGIPKSFSPNGMPTVSVTSFLEDDYDIDRLNRVRSCSVNYTTFSGSNGIHDCNDFQSIYGAFLSRMKHVKINENDELDKKKEHIESMKKQVSEMYSLSLAKLLELYDVESVLPENVRNNELLVFLLRRGYIDETYTNYINYFKGTTITTQDMNFILNVKNQKTMDYDYELKNTDMIVKMLPSYEFEQSIILNYDLLEYLLSASQEKQKLDLFISALSNDGLKCKDFVNVFIDRTSYKEKVIDLLAKKWFGMWRAFVSDEIITYERKLYILGLIISYAPVDSIVLMDEENILVDFFVEHEDILVKLSSVDDDKLIRLIPQLDIKFNNVALEGVSEKVRTYIIDNCCYVINYGMIKRIIDITDKDLSMDLVHKNYTTLMKSNNIAMLEYIRENIELYTKNVFLMESNTDEDLEAVLDIIYRNISDVEICLEIVRHESFMVEDMSSCLSELFPDEADGVRQIWVEIISSEKMICTWSNVYTYWANYGYTDILISYIENHVSELSNENYPDVEDFGFVEDFIRSEVQCSEFEQLIAKLPKTEITEMIADIKEDKMLVLIKQGYLEFNVKTLETISKEQPQLVFEYIICNQNEFMNIHNDFSVDGQLIEMLVLDDRMEACNADVLLNVYGVDNMNSTIAKHIIEKRRNITIDVFLKAWELLSNDDRERLMRSYLHLIDANIFEQLFSELDGDFNAFTRRGFRHDENLGYSEDNVELAKRLKTVEYITSYEVKERDVFSKEERKVIKVKYIVCRIKATN